MIVRTRDPMTGKQRPFVVIRPGLMNPWINAEALALYTYSGRGFGGCKGNERD